VREGESSIIVKPRSERQRRAIGSREALMADNGEDTNGSEEEVQEEAYEDDCSKVRLSECPIQLYFVVFGG
jgi:hypothetical protein